MNVSGEFSDLEDDNIETFEELATRNNQFEEENKGYSTF